MSYLVDAHALIWYRAGDAKLPSGVQALLGGGERGIFISDVTFWELTIKHTLGKLTLVGGVESLHREWIEQEMAETLSIGWKHIKGLSNLPSLHGDPFDRLLVAQSLHEGMMVVTGDAQIHQYPGVKVFWE